MHLAARLPFFLPSRTPTPSAWHLWSWCQWTHKKMMGLAAMVFQHSFIKPVSCSMCVLAGQSEQRHRAVGVVGAGGPECFHSWKWYIMLRDQSEQSCCHKPHPLTCLAYYITSTISCYKVPQTWLSYWPLVVLCFIIYYIHYMTLLCKIPWIAINGYTIVPTFMEWVHLYL